MSPFRLCLSRIFSVPGWLCPTPTPCFLPYLLSAGTLGVLHLNAGLLGEPLPAEQPLSPSVLTAPRQVSPRLLPLALALYAFPQVCF